jgi:hypothetical protein
MNFYCNKKERFYRGMRFQAASGEKQGEIASALQYPVKASFGDAQEYKGGPGTRDKR